MRQALSLDLASGTGVNVFMVLSANHNVILANKINTNMLIHIAYFIQILYVCTEKQVLEAKISLYMGNFGK